MKRIKLLMATLPLLMAICLMSTGFAGWVSVYNAAAEVSDSFEGYGVIDFTSVITTSGPQIFSIKAESFVNEQGENQDYGSIIVPYSIDLAKCTSNNITVHLSLSYEGLASSDKDLFVMPPARSDGHTYNYTISVVLDTIGEDVADISVSDVAATLNVTETAGDITVTNYGTRIDVDIDMTVTAGSGTKAFNVIYTFNIPRDTTAPSDASALPVNFRECFGKYLDVRADSQTKFVTTAWVENKQAQNQ